MEAYHVASAHPQTTAYDGDVNTQYDVWPNVKHINRMISAQGVSSPSKPHLDDATIRAQMERDTPSINSARSNRKIRDWLPRSPTFKLEEGRQPYSERTAK